MGNVDGLIASPGVFMQTGSCSLNAPGSEAWVS